MDGLAIELTNVCNRRCLHCIRNNRADPRNFCPWPLAREILAQAKALGFRTICLTGGEVALYPYLEEFLALVVDQGFTFNLVTNGHRFRENLLPLLSAPKIREKLTVVCFSLDGAKPETHDALRGPGSFREVVEAATLCQLKGLPFSFKTVITNFNKEELTEVALLGATLAAQDHGFSAPLSLAPVIREGVFPPPDEVGKSWVDRRHPGQGAAPKIFIEGLGSRTTLFTCPNILKGATWIIRETWSSAATFPTSPGKKGNPASSAGNGWGSQRNVPPGRPYPAFSRRGPTHGGEARDGETQI
jgi:pyruvate-formate lyase-activating enzyme